MTIPWKFVWYTSTAFGRTGKFKLEDQNPGLNSETLVGCRFGSQYLGLPHGSFMIAPSKCRLMSTSIMSVKKYGKWPKKKYDNWVILKKRTYPIRFLQMLLFLENTWSFTPWKKKRNLWLWHHILLFPRKRWSPKKQEQYNNYQQ